MYFSCGVLICLFLSTVQFGYGLQRAESLKEVNTSAIIDNLLRDYDKRVRPDASGPPVEIQVTMYVLSVSSISEVQMDFTMDFYFRQTWTDTRLSYDSRYGLNKINLDLETSSKLWVPDTFFANEKHSYFHMATTPNVFTSISKNGEVTKSIRLTVTAACPMDLQYFPMDNQVCSLEVESYASNARDIVYKWKNENAVGVSHEMELPQFTLVGHRQKLNVVSLSSGNYSRLICSFQFVRSTGYYILQIYMPACMIVIVSWVSFWLNRSNMLARVALSITTVLTITTLMSSVNASLPKLSYIKSLDVYLISCFLMVFAALIEQAAIEYVARRIRNRNILYKTHGDSVGYIKGMGVEKNQMELGHITSVEDGNLNECDGVGPTNIDKYSQIGFPIVFLVFNVLYCIIYTSVSDETF